MRKLIKESNKMNTLEGIAATCACRAICRPADNFNTQFAIDLQSQYAHTGTMPQGIVNDN